MESVKKRITKKEKRKKRKRKKLRQQEREREALWQQQQQQQRQREGLHCVEEIAVDEREIDTLMGNDLITMMLVCWPLKQMITYTKLLLIIINRNHVRESAPYRSHNIPESMERLFFMDYPSEYRETLFSDYALIEYHDESEGHLIRRQIFRRYYNDVYKSARRALYGERDTPLCDEERSFYICLLSVCFLVSLVYDARIRRFVLSKHDYHYKYMKTSPPSTLKTVNFISDIKPSVDEYLKSMRPQTSLYATSKHLWFTNYCYDGGLRERRGEGGEEEVEEEDRIPHRVHSS